MKSIIAIGGSNSKNSINKALATYTAHLVGDAKATIIDLNDFEMPLYGIDLENEKGIPDKAQELSNILDGADGLVFSLAEHNGSYSVAFKNVMDWMSRLEGKLWKDKPMLLMATSPGGRGGATVLQAAKTSFPHMGANVVADFSLPFFGKNFSENGILDPELAKMLHEKVEIFSKAL